MQAGEPKDEGGEGTGFSGLSSMVSDVEETVRAAEKQKAAIATSAPVAKPTSPGLDGAVPKPSTHAGWWVLGVMVVFFVGMAIYGNSTTSSSNSSTPAIAEPQPIAADTPQPSALPTADVAPQPSPAQSTPIEEAPPVGIDNVLTMPQLQYCLDQNLRMSGAEATVDLHIGPQVDQYNAMVVDFNNRCGHYRYDPSEQARAKPYSEMNRNALIGEGRAIILAVSTAGTTSDSATQSTDQVAAWAATQAANQAPSEPTPAPPQIPQQSLSTVGDQPPIPASPAGDATPPAAATTPENAVLDYSGRWVCKRGFRQGGSGCVAVDMPENATLDYTGSAWVCKRGFHQVGADCIAVAMPENATLDYTGSAWVCKRGFHQVGADCIAVAMPENATLDYTGGAWVCKRGFRQAGAECVPVAIPENATLDYTGSAWVCKRGFRQIGAVCDVVSVPENATLDYTGSSWTCVQGYTQVGDKCLPHVN